LQQAEKAKKFLPERAAVIKNVVKIYTDKKSYILMMIEAIECLIS
jgi:hypothetical protein